MDICDIAIVGMGPGGIGAGIYAIRGGWETLAFNEGPPGGQMLNTDIIDNYPGFSKIKGPELAKKMKEHLNDLGLEINHSRVKQLGVEDGLKTLKTTDGDYKAKVLIIATGGSPRKLEVPGEKEFAGKGVSYCAVCDGPFFKGKDVVVVGGGDAAVDESLYLSKIVDSVRVVHRRQELRAAKYYQEKAFETDNISFIWDSVVTSIEGENTVKQVTLENVNTGEKRKLKTDGVFIYIGFTPNTDIVSDLVEFTEDDHIKVDRNLETSRQGIYAIGDVREGSHRQIGTSIGDGISAVLNSEEYLRD